MYFIGSVLMEVRFFLNIPLMGNFKDIIVGRFRRIEIKEINFQ
jgi:hypothetical protein